MTFFLSVCLLVMIFPHSDSAESWQIYDYMLGMKIVDYQNTNMQDIACKDVIFREKMTVSRSETLDYGTINYNVFYFSAITPDMYINDNPPIYMNSTINRCKKGGKISCFHTLETVELFFTAWKNCRDFPALNTKKISGNVFENDIPNKGPVLQGVNMKAIMYLSSMTADDPLQNLYSRKGCTLGLCSRQEFTCTIAIPDDSKHRLLPAGKYVKEINGFYYFVGKLYVWSVIVEDCAPGTWLTCEQTLDGCQYKMPVQQLDGLWEWDKYGQIWYVALGTFKEEERAIYRPYGHCYPCNSSVDKTHYSNYSQCLDVTNQRAGPTCRATISRLEDHKIICPGKAFPPILCPENAERDKDYINCVCKAGLYDVNGVCTVCPPGHYCVFGRKNPCPDGSFQDRPGSSECSPCNYKDMLISCDNNFLPVKCTMANDPINLTYLKSRQCVSCSQCKNSVIDSAKNMAGVGGTTALLDCYDP